MSSAKIYKMDGSIEEIEKCFISGSSIRMYHLNDKIDIYENFESNLKKFNDLEKNKKYKWNLEASKIYSFTHYFLILELFLANVFFIHCFKTNSLF